jgi:hypothetical protein
MPLEEKQKAQIRAVLSDEVSYEDMKSRLINEHTRVDLKYGT